MTDKPNVVFVFADQWHAQACGYNGNPTVNTPNIDRLAAFSVNVQNAVEGKDFSPYLCGDAEGADTDALLLCAIPFGQWTRPNVGRECRGMRTPCYTYVRDKDGPGCSMTTKGTLTSCTITVTLMNTLAFRQT